MQSFERFSGRTLSYGRYSMVENKKIGFAEHGSHLA
jgi:hypothetical protein